MSPSAPSSRRGKAKALGLPARALEQIAYAAEESIRAVLADAKAQRRLLAELAHVAIVDARRGTPRKKIERTLARSSKSVVDAWIATRISKALDRAEKEIARRAKERRALLARIRKMDARRLHAFANRYNWDDGVYALDAVVRHPKCALGTALLVYWLAKPHWFAQWRSANASDDPETFRLLAYVEARIARGDYAHAGVAFDPRKERLVEDTYDEEPKTRALPPHVFAATTRTGVATFAPERRR